MSESASHLVHAAQEALTLSTEQRIARIRRPRWIGYPRAVAILAQLDELLSLPKTHRMPNLLIVGDTNNGKTMIVTRFAKKHAALLTRDGIGVSVPVVFVQAPPVPDENRFYAALLDAVCPTYSVSVRIPAHVSTGSGDVSTGYEAVGAKRR